MEIDPSDLFPSLCVTIRAFDEIPEHTFLIDAVLDDCIAGYAVSGPLKGEYGEPDFGLILRILG